MNLQQVLRVFQRFWTLIVSVLAVGITFAAVALLVVAPQYSASSKVFVSNQGSLSTTEQLLQGSNYAQGRIASYAEVVNDPIVLNRAIADLELDTTAEALSGKVSASYTKDQLLIEISAKQDSPEAAADLANAVARALSTAITEEIEKPGPGREAAVTVTITKEALPNAAPAWPVTWIFLAVGGGGALALGIGLAFLLNALDTRVRTVEDVRAVTDAPILGMVAKAKRLADTPVVREMAGRSQFAEAIRALRTNLQFLDAGGTKRRVMLISSSIPAEGKSTIALSLALSIAETERRVLLIDADLRNPRLSSLLGLEGGAGLTDLLVGRARLDAIVQSIGASGYLSVISSGRMPPNPAELLGSPQFAALLDELRADYDYIVIDSPPVLPVTDAVVLSRVVDAVVYVIGAERARTAQVKTGIDAFAQVQAPLAGLVVNRLARTGVDAYSYYAYGYYGTSEQSVEDEGLNVLQALSKDDPSAPSAHIEAAATAQAQPPAAPPAVPPITTEPRIAPNAEPSPTEPGYRRARSDAPFAALGNDGS